MTSNGRAAPVANPFSSGGGGTSFEQRVAATYLVALLGEEIPRGLDAGRAAEVRFQALQLGVPLDDLLVTSRQGAESWCLALQVKHKVVFAASNPVFQEVMAAAWETWTGARGWRFRRGRDRLGLAIGALTPAIGDHVLPLLEWARGSLSAGEFIAKVETPGFAHEEKRRSLARLRTALGAAARAPLDDGELWGFLKDFVILHFDLEHAGGRDATAAWNRLLGLAGGDAREARGMFERLVAEAGRLAAVAGSIDAVRLRERLGQARPGGSAAGSGVEAAYRCLAPRPVGYVARGEHATVVAHLLAAAAEPAGRSVGIATALRGAGGFGKTTLAQALCHDPRVQAAYRGGILWVTMGEQLTDGERLSRLRDLLRRWLDGEPPAFETVAAAGGYLCERLAGRQVLLVVDDVWSPMDLAPFRNLDPASTLLATTRDRRNLPEGCLAEPVDAMASGEALELLGAGLPGLPRARLQALAGRLGEWPLLLALVHRQLRERIEVEGLQPERALGEVEGVLAEEGLEAFDRGDVAARELAVGRTLGASLRLLAEDERRRYEELAIFPEDAAIPCATLAVLWDLPHRRALELCRRLDQLSLAARFDAGSETFRLHDVVRAWLRGRAGDGLAARQSAFLERLRPPGGWPALPPAEPYLWRGLAYHLAEAGRGAELRALLLDYGWMEAKLAATDVNALLADYDAGREEAELRLVQGALRLAAHVLGEHPEELAGQVVGRLLGRTEPGIVALRERIRPRRSGPWIRPMSASLSAPGGALLQILLGHSGSVNALAALGDGRVVSASEDCSLRVWDLATGETVRTLEGHADSVNAVAALREGRLVCGSGDGSVRVWDLATGETVRTLEGHGDSVRAVAALPDGRVVSGSDDRSLRVWDLATGEAALTLKGHAPVLAVAALPNGRIVSGSDDCSLRVWDLATGETVRTLAGHTDWVNAVAALPDGRVVSGSEDGSLRVWDLTGGETLRTLPDDTKWVKSVAALPDGRVVACSDDGGLCVRDVAGETVRTLGGRTDWVNAVGALPDGRVVSGSHDGSLCVWDLAGGETVRTLGGQSSPVNAVAALPGGRVVSGADNGNLRVWDLATGETVGTLKGHARPVLVVAALPDGRVVSGSADGSLRVWDLATGETVRTLEGHSHSVLAVAALPGGRVVSGSSDDSLRVWDLAGGETVQTLTGHSGWVNAVAVLPGGRVVSGSDDGSLRVWDLAAGAVVARLTVEALVTCLAAAGAKAIVAGLGPAGVHVFRLEDGP
jgi:WD40 repeat protein